MNNESYVHYSRAEAERVSGITIPPNKRNGRKQKLHLKMARSNLAIMSDDIGKPLQGRPVGSGTKKEQVAAWRFAHPDGRKADCIRETGLSKPTVYKWWSV